MSSPEDAGEGEDLFYFMSDPRGRQVIESAGQEARAFCDRLPDDVPVVLVTVSEKLKER